MRRGGTWAWRLRAALAEAASVAATAASPLTGRRRKTFSRCTRAMRPGPERARGGASAGCGEDFSSSAE